MSLDISWINVRDKDESLFKSTVYPSEDIECMHRSAEEGDKTNILPFISQKKIMEHLNFLDLHLDTFLRVVYS